MEYQVVESHSNGEFQAKVNDWAARGYKMVGFQYHEDPPASHSSDAGTRMVSAAMRQNRYRTYVAVMESPSF